MVVTRLLARRCCICLCCKVYYNRYSWRNQILVHKVFRLASCALCIVKLSELGCGRLEVLDLSILRCCKRTIQYQEVDLQVDYFSRDIYFELKYKNGILNSSVKLKSSSNFTANKLICLVTPSSMLASNLGVEDTYSNIYEIYLSFI